MQNGAWPRRSLPFQVLAAILMVAAATALTTVLKLFAPQFTFGIYYAAVVIIAYYVGIRAGVLTALVRRSYRQLPICARRRKDS